MIINFSYYEKLVLAFQIQWLRVVISVPSLVQNKIEELTITNNDVEELADNDDIIYTKLLNNIIKTIQEHSQLIIYYSSNGENNIDHSLIPALKNLKTLFNYICNVKMVCCDHLCDHSTFLFLDCNIECYK